MGWWVERPFFVRRLLRRRKWFSFKIIPKRYQSHSYEVSLLVNSYLSRTWISNWIDSIFFTFFVLEYFGLYLTSFFVDLQTNIVSFERTRQDSVSLWITCQKGTLLICKLLVYLILYPWSRIALSGGNNSFNTCHTLGSVASVSFNVSALLISIFQL